MLAAMTRDHIRLVQGSFAAIEAAPEIFVERFYARLSELDPALRSTIDWTLREGARAKIRVIVKRILNKHCYPPDLQDEAVKTVLQQAELLCAEWV